jgi:biopolymer transport protein ExbD
MVEREKTMILAATLLALAAHAAPLRASDLERAFEVKVGLGKSGCTVAFNGRRFDQQGYADELHAFARKRRATRVVVKGDKALPYRCVGGVVFVLQRAGVADITFVDDEKK